MSSLLLRHVALPAIFLTAALLGGLRFAADDLALRFVAPPLATLLLAAFLLALFARARLVDVSRDWIDARRPPLENTSNALTLVALYAATVQVFNAVLPEDTLFFSIFVLVFALVLWNNLFAVVRPDRLVISTGGLLMAVFVVKWVLLAALFEPSDSLAKSIVQSLLRGVTLGGLESEPWSRATGYTAFACVALYLVGLWASSPPREPDEPREQRMLDRVERRELSEAVDAEIER